MAEEKILIIGATGYIGKFIAKASLALGYPTSLLVRPGTSSDKAKSELLDSLKASGATILSGDLEDYESLVLALKHVDVVISTVGGAVDGAQIGAQANIIKAIKEVGTIKRFLPSEFGVEYGQIKKIHPVLQPFFNPKLEIRKAVQEAGIPYTFVASNGFAGWHLLPGLTQPGQFTPPRDKISIWGDGNGKAVLVEENDVGTYTIKAAVDPRTLNKVVHIRPPANVLSFNEVVAIWEKKIGKSLEKTFVPEAEILKSIEETPFPNNIPIAIVHGMFVQSEEVEVEFEAAELYPDVAYTTTDAYLSRLV